MRRVPPLRRPRLHPIAVLVIAVVALAPSAAGADARTGGSGNRKEARILDSLPVVPDSETGRVRDKVREFTATISIAEVIAFYRSQLPSMGWTEQSVAQGTGQASDLDGRGGEREDSDTGVISGGKDSTADGSGSQEGTAGGPTDGQEDSASGGNSPEVGNRGPDDGGVDAGSDPSQAGPIRATFTKGKARLKVVARAIADADQQTSSNAENATEGSEYRLAVKLR